MTTSGQVITKHAHTRIYQRGLRETDILHVRDFGAVYHAGKGCMAFLVDKDAVKRARKDGIDLTRLRGVGAIEVDGGVIVTVARYRRRPRRWR